MATIGGLSAYQSQMSVTSDKNFSAIYYGDTRTSAIALALCAGLKRHPEYTNMEERLNIETILGDGLSNLIDSYLNRYPPGDESPARDQAWSALVASHTLSLVKCEVLKQLILKNPFIIVLKDSECLGADGKTTLLYHYIVLKIDEIRASALVGNNLAVIRQRTTQTEITIYAVSQLGWNAIQETIAKYSNHLAIDQPLLRQTPLQNSNCCCSIL